MSESKYGSSEKDAKNEEMINQIKMTCLRCNQIVKYALQDSCPSCGFITIECKNCDKKWMFGE